MKITPPNPLSTPLPGGTPGGSAGGDLGGTFPGPTVTGLQGTPVCVTTPTTGQALVFDGTEWCPDTFSGDFLSVINGGGGTVQAHGNLGATETIDTAGGNYHWGTLNANCTFTFTTIADTAERWFTLELLEDGTGGWTVTWPGSVSWLGGTTPTHTTTAGTTTIYVFFTRNGGTTWIGGQLGAGATFATPAIVLGTAAAAGAAATVIRSDSTIVAFDATVPTTSAVADAAATGSVALASRRDHKHGRESFGTPVSVGTANADGVAPTVPRSDHVHAGALTDGQHVHVDNVTFSGDASQTVWELPAAPVDAYTVAAYVAGARTAVTLSGALLTTMTFGSAPASGTDNIIVDIAAVLV